MQIKTFMTAFHTRTGSVDSTVFIYVGLKADSNSCKWNIFEQLKKVHYV